MGRFLYATIWTVLSAAEGHFESAIDGQNPSAQAIDITISFNNILYITMPRHITGFWMISF